MKVFCDLDGCLVNFTGGYAKLLGIEDPYLKKENWGNGNLAELVGLSQEEFIAPLNFDFWANLEPTKECFEIIEILEKKFFKEDICILSKPVRTKDSASGKIAWIEKYLPQYARRYLLGPEKWFCAQKNSLLIDDYDKYILDFASTKGAYYYFVERPHNNIYGRNIDMKDFKEFVESF